MDDGVGGAQDHLFSVYVDKTRTEGLHYVELVKEGKEHPERKLYIHACADLSRTLAEQDGEVHIEVTPRDAEAVTPFSQLSFKGTVKGEEDIPKGDTVYELNPRLLTVDGKVLVP